MGSIYPFLIHLYCFIFPHCIMLLEKVIDTHCFHLLIPILCSVLSYQSFLYMPLHWKIPYPGHQPPTSKSQFVHSLSSSYSAFVTPFDVSPSLRKPFFLGFYSIPQACLWVIPSSPLFCFFSVAFSFSSLIWPPNGGLLRLSPQPCSLLV